MFFQELPGLSKFKFYPTNSLPLLSHIPVEELRDCGIAELRDLSTGDHPVLKLCKGLEITQSRNYAIAHFAFDK